MKSRMESKMSSPVVIGVDIGKDVFHLVGFTADVESCHSIAVPRTTGIKYNPAVHPDVDEGRSTSSFYRRAYPRYSSGFAGSGKSRHPQKVAGICHVGSRRHRLPVPNPPGGGIRLFRPRWR